MLSRRSFLGVVAALSFAGSAGPSAAQPFDEFFDGEWHHVWTMKKNRPGTDIWDVTIHVDGVDRTGHPSAHLLHLGEMTGSKEHWVPAGFMSHSAWFRMKG